jgi:hypothetical protein
MPMTLDKVSWAGLMIVAFGWALLFSAPQAAELLPRPAGDSLAHLDVASIAFCIILSGFGIAILGALQTGFGALNKFFGSVLERSSGHQEKPSSHRPAQQKKIVERGWVKNRAYVLYMDGSVEIETLLGRRIFPSLQDAQEFIA